MADGDSVGGVVECKIEGLPIGIGEPVFDKLHARLASAMMTINAAKAFEYGDGIEAADMPEYLPRQSGHSQYAVSCPPGAGWRSWHPSVPKLPPLSRHS